MQVQRTVSIQVTLQPISVYPTVSPSTGYINQTITLSVDWSPVSGQPTNVNVTWGDGATGATVIPYPPAALSHTYGSAGTYTISVTIFDSWTGGSGTGSTSVQIASALTASLSASPTSGTAPLNVTFTFDFSGGYTPRSYTLDFGDGSTPVSGSTPGTASHSYGGGTFTATLTVNDGLGLAFTRTLTIGAESILIPLALAGLILGLIIWKG